MSGFYRKEPMALGFVVIPSRRAGSRVESYRPFSPIHLLHHESTGHYRGVDVTAEEIVAGRCRGGKGIRDR